MKQDIVSRIVCGVITFLSIAAFFTGLQSADALGPMQTYESFGFNNYYSSSTSVASSHTISGYLTSWSVLANGTGSVTFTLKASTQQPTSSGYTLNASSPIILVGGQTASDTAVRGLVTNFLLSVDSVGAGTTAYVDIGYLAPRGGGL